MPRQGQGFGPARSFPYPRTKPRRSPSRAPITELPMSGWLTPNDENGVQWGRSRVEVGRFAEWETETELGLVRMGVPRIESRLDS